MATEINQVIEQLVIDDSQAKSGAQGFINTMQGVAAAADKAKSGLAQLEQMGASIGPAQRSAQTAFERWGAVANQNERAFQQMVRAENEMFRAVQQGYGSLEQMNRILDEMWQKAFRASEATEALARAQRAAASQNAFNAQLGVRSDFGSAERAADIAAYGQELDRLRAKYVPLAAAQQAYKAELLDINRALKTGAISEAEHAAALTRTKTAFAQSIVEMRRTQTGLGALTARFGGAGMAVQQAGFQVGDFFVQVASGQSPMRAFIQQGTQILQFFGPWGAVIGAAGAVVGALAISLLDLGEETDTAAEKAEKFEDQYSDISDLMDEIDGKVKRTTESLRAHRQFLIETAQAQIDQIDANLKAIPEFTGYGRAGAAKNQEYINAGKQAAQDRANQLANLAKLGAFGDGRSLMGQSNQDLIDDLNEAAKRVADEAARDYQRALDEMAKANRDFEKSFLDLQDEIDPGSGALRDYEKAVDTLNLAQERGIPIIGGYEAAYAKLFQLYEDKIDPAAAALRKLNEEQDRQQAAMEAEAATIGMSADERRIYLAGIQAENDLKAKNVPLTQDGARGYIDEAKAIEKAKIEHERMTKAAEAGQNELANFIDQSSDRIGSAITEAFAQGEIAVVKFRDIGKAAVSELAQWLFKLAAINPLKNWINGNTSLPTLGSVFGGGATVQTASGQSVGGVGGGASSFGGFNLGGLFTSNSGGLGSMLFGTAGTPVYSNGIQIGTSPGASGLFGTGGGGSLGTFLNTPFGGGLGAGLLGFGGALLSGQDVGSAAITGGLSGIGFGIGSIFGAGPIGGMVGGLLGSVFGGLFGEKPKLKKDEAQAFLDANAFGLPGVFQENDDHKLGDLGGQLGMLAKESITDLLTSVGAVMDPETVARLSYYHSTKGGKTKSEFYKASIFNPIFGPNPNGNTTGFGAFGGEIGRYDSAEEAAAAVAAGTLFASGLSGNIRGTGASTQKAFEALWKDAGRKVEGLAAYDSGFLTEIIDFTKWIDGLEKARTASDAAAKALIDFEGALAKAQSQAEDLGLSAEQAFTAMKRDFTESIEDELLALTDPEGLALRELEKEYAARKAVAQELGLDLVDLEKLYALKRQEVLDQGLQGVADSWKDFINALQFGEASALSPVDQLENARKQYEASKATGGAAFREAATTYLGLSQQFYGSTKPYADLYAEVIALAKQFGGLEGVPGFASGGFHAGGWRVVGERGPEMEATGPARIYSASDTAAILKSMTANDNRGRSDQGMARVVASFAESVREMTAAQKRSENESRRLREALMARVAK